MEVADPRLAASANGAAPEVASPVIERLDDLNVYATVTTGTYVINPQPADWRHPWPHWVLLDLSKQEAGLDEDEEIALWDAACELEAEEREVALWCAYMNEKRIGRTAAQLLADEPEETDWLVPGFLVPGWATKLAGREKIGKGTTVYYLLGKLERGEDTVFGPVRHAVTSLILTEEPPESAREKIEAFGLERSQIIPGYELASKTWDEKVAALIEQANLYEHAVVFVDNVSRSAGIEEEGGVELARAAEKLQDACREAGLALLMDHHHKKGRDSIENKSRGGTGLAGAMDINIELERIGAIDSRRRRLTARGRLRATNWKLAVELAEDGSEFVVASDESSSADDDQQAVDLMYLLQAGAVTSEGFAGIIGRTERTARRRLDSLVLNKLAVYTPGKAGPDGKFPPGTWSVIGPRAEDTTEPRT